MNRIDVFSAKGGVGKTTVAYRLALKMSQSTKLPVLIIDADLSGTCLGDLVASWVDPVWTAQKTLIGLVCGRPEDLPEQLMGELPVYEVSPPASSDSRIPTRVRPSTSKDAILFCPSHADNDLTIFAAEDKRPMPADPALLHALVGHESAGGWVGHVIRKVIDATSSVLDRKLGGVIVDHGPGIGSLQWAEMTLIERELEKAWVDKRPPTRAAVFVLSRDGVDIQAISALDARMAVDKRQKMARLKDAAVWVVHRLPKDLGPSDRWRKALIDDLGARWRPSPYGWFMRAKPLFFEESIANSYAHSDLVSGFVNGDQDTNMIELWETVARGMT